MYIFTYFAEHTYGWVMLFTLQHYYKLYNCKVAVISNKRTYNLYWVPRSHTERLFLQRNTTVARVMRESVGTFVPHCLFVVLDKILRCGRC